MKMNILKTAMALGLVAVSGASFAATVVTSFSGLIGNTCTLTQTSAGVMTTSAAGTGINAGETGATKGVITVACNTTGTVSVGNPVGVGAAAITALSTANYGSTVETLAGVDVATNGRDFAGTSSSIGSANYEVHAWIATTSVLPDGNYAITVTTTLIAD